MLVKEWNELPKFMQVEEVRPYYEILRKKKAFSIGVLNGFRDDTVLNT